MDNCLVHYYSFLSPINKLHLHLFACTQTSFPQKHLHITHRLKGTRLKYICTYIFTVYKSIQNLCCMVQEHFRASIDVHNQNCFIIAHYMGFVKHPAYTHLLFFLTVTTRESSSILCSTILPTIISDATNHLENKNHPDLFPFVLLPSSQQFPSNSF